MKIRQGDEVLVVAGKDRGKRGTVRIVDVRTDKVVVTGVNVVKKHQKPRPGVRQSGIIDKEMPLHVSNVILQCPRCNAPTRIAVRRDEAGHKTRHCKRCNDSVDQA